MSRLAKSLRNREAEVFAPTLTGLGERVHLASPDTGLTTHIEDVHAVLHYEDLRDVVLVGHSYGGAVITGVADRARDRISRLIYLDAFVLKDGQSVADVCPPGMVEALTGLARQTGGDWRVPLPFTMEQLGVSNPDDVAWIERGMAMQPLKTMVEAVTLSPEPWPFPVSYVLCTGRSMGLFEQFGLYAQESGWDYHEMPWTHAAPALVPDECAELLMRIAGSEGSRAAV